MLYEDEHEGPLYEEDRAPSVGRRSHERAVVQDGALCCFLSKHLGFQYPGFRTNFVKTVFKTIHHVLSLHEIFKTALVGATQDVIMRWSTLLPLKKFQPPSIAAHMLMNSYTSVKK